MRLPWLHIPASIAACAIITPCHVYEKVERVTPSRADLEAMTGEYTSDEAEVSLKVELDKWSWTMTIWWCAAAPIRSFP